MYFINPLYSDGFSHIMQINLIRIGLPIIYFEGPHKLNNDILQSLKIVIILANSVDPDKM